MGSCGLLQLLPLRSLELVRVGELRLPGRGAEVLWLWLHHRDVTGRAKPEDEPLHELLKDLDRELEAELGHVPRRHG